MNSIRQGQRDNFKNKNKLSFFKKTSNLSHKPKHSYQHSEKNLNKDKKSFQSMKNSTNKYRRKKYRKVLKMDRNGNLQRIDCKVT